MSSTCMQRPKRADMAAAAALAATADARGAARCGVSGFAAATSEKERARRGRPRDPVNSRMASKARPHACMRRCPRSHCLGGGGLPAPVGPRQVRLPGPERSLARHLAVLPHGRLHLQHDLLPQGRAHVPLEVPLVEQQQDEGEQHGHQEPREEGAKADAVVLLGHVGHEGIPRLQEVLALPRLLDEARADGAGDEVRRHHPTEAPPVDPERSR
mmetsp:Transcript_27950/g.87056  ORF Transcript_27950/g.87056 Transcript_27950/m.87056 type:complete len:214 (-) Transcript_27950:1129-1770(-)